MTPELEDLRKTLRQVFALHLNASTGYTMGYKIIDADGKTVGYKSQHTTKKPPKKTTVVYTIGDAEFSTPEAFLTAYRESLRDKEWDAAAPKSAVMKQLDLIDAPKPSKYFPDQPVIRGADVIYRPAGNAGEYAPLATNPWKGCGHGCKYCYVPNATHIDRNLFNEAAVLRQDYFERLIPDLKRHQHLSGGAAEQIFITFSSDPFHLGDLRPTQKVMHALQIAGLAFCTLSKGGSRALPFIREYRPDRDAYACTLTSLDDRFSTKWEPKAALPGDRIATLKKFYDADVFTWVSLEPTLDVEASLAIVEATHGFVDLFKIGRANYCQEITRTTDWRTYTLRMVDLCQKLGVRHYVKKDLQKWLPEGYENPLRVQQHR